MNKSRAGLHRDWIIPKAQYNRMTKKFGKATLDAVKDEDLDEFRLYMKQRISDCQFFEDRAARSDDPDSICKALMFHRIHKELDRITEESRERAAGLDIAFFEKAVTFDKKGQGTFNFTVMA